MNKNMNKNKQFLSIFKTSQKTQSILMLYIDFYINILLLVIKEILIQDSVERQQDMFISINKYGTSYRVLFNNNLNDILKEYKRINNFNKTNTIITNTITINTKILIIFLFFFILKNYLNKFFKYIMNILINLNINLIKNTILFIKSNIVFINIFRIVLNFKESLFKKFLINKNKNNKKNSSYFNDIEFINSFVKIKDSLQEFLIDSPPFSELNSFRRDCLNSNLNHQCTFFVEKARNLLRMELKKLKFT